MRPRRTSFSRHFFLKRSHADPLVTGTVARLCLGDSGLHAVPNSGLDSHIGPDPHNASGSCSKCHPDIGPDPVAISVSISDSLAVSISNPVTPSCTDSRRVCSGHVPHV